MELTVVLLKSIVEYNPTTGLVVWRKKIARKVIVGVCAGNVHRNGYRRIRIFGKEHKEHRLIWFYMTGVWPPDEIDHKDQNKANNRWGNLRLATRQQNSWNIKRKAGKLGLLGVRPAEAEGRFYARVGGKHQLHLGTFNTKEEAHRAYVHAVGVLCGEFRSTE